MVEKKKKKKRKTGINIKAKKKAAVARAVIRKGNGKIKLNKLNLKTITPVRVKTFIEEPLTLAGEVAKTVDIDVTISGGGFMGQAVAARGAIAKALVTFSKDAKLKEKFLAYDRLLLVDDARRKESKKPLGPGARKKKQQSKR
ncbi:MAG: 30S ribosomal protein S9 [Candidatus Diapherotrites archaeon]|uniref:30S ribosomal protein S9 n=1 Tax=Candidatus Iainarchaeum sp. TaxID=3101447 RepID=A0A2D6M0L7_9ARCH|nr:30S ribosomal protein S9 [Candidatus Diapherotrites archaeon]|tara:strand:- start:10247 stop:10675 length:429 start_codon:yes stop_codon:yes gene_type:complete